MYFQIYLNILMEQKLNRDVTDEEIAKQLNWSEKSIRELK